VWAQGGQQPALEEALGVGGFGYPALVAFAPKDAKLSTMRRCGCVCLACVWCVFRVCFASASVGGLDERVWGEGCAVNPASETTLNQPTNQPTNQPQSKPPPPPPSAFEAKPVVEFIENIRRGYERVAPLAGGKTELPEAATVAPWDGKDAQVGFGVVGG
jgi:hypothetical protein